MSDPTEPTPLEVATLAARLIAGGKVDYHPDWPVTATDRALDLLEAARESLLKQQLHAQSVSKHVEWRESLPEFQVSEELVAAYDNSDPSGRDDPSRWIPDVLVTDFDEALERIVPGDSKEERSQRFQQWAVSRFGEEDGEKYVEERRLGGFSLSQWMELREFDGWWKEHKSVIRSTVGKIGASKKSAKKKAAAKKSARPRKKSSAQD